MEVIHKKEISKKAKKRLERMTSDQLDTHNLRISISECCKVTQKHPHKITHLLFNVFHSS